MNAYLIKTLKSTGIIFTLTEVDYIYCMIQISELEKKIDFKTAGTIITSGLNETYFDLYNTAKNKMAELKPNWEVLFNLLEKVGENFGI